MPTRLPTSWIISAGRYNSAMRAGVLVLTAAGLLFGLSGSSCDATNPSSTQAYFPPIYTGLGSPYADGPESKRAFDKLRSIVVPKVDFEDEDINKAVDFLNVESRRLDPDHRGVQFRLWLLDCPVKQLSGPQWDLKVHLREARLCDVVQAICEDDDMGYGFSKGIVQLCPSELPTMPVKPASALRAEKNFVRRLRSIVFPRVEIDHEEITKVVAYLNEQSPKLDPQHIGVKVILRLPSTSGVAGINFLPYRTNVAGMTLRDATLQDVLGYAVNQTQLEYHLEPDTESIIVEPISKPPR